jgi:hypothetical protein
MPMSELEEKVENPIHVKVSKLATTSLVLGVSGIPLIGSILGHLALSQINKSSGRLKGKKIAVLGIVLGYANIFLILLLIFLVRYLLVETSLFNRWI